MKKKRETKEVIVEVGVVLLPLVLAIALEIVTGGIINYNIYTRVVTFIVYAALLFFIVVDGYCLVTSKDEYFKYSFPRNVLMLVTIVLGLSFWTKIRNPLIIVTVVTLIVVIIVLLKKCNQYIMEYNGDDF